MTYRFLVITSLRALREHKGRSFLTILSIIVGIASVIATLAIGRGAQEKIKRRIASLGDNFIAVYAGNRMQSGSTKVKKQKQTKDLTLKDLELIKQVSPDITHASPLLTLSNILIKTERTSIISKLNGVSPSYPLISNKKLAAGHFFNYDHAQTHQNIIILGSEAAVKLFPHLKNKLDSILGQQVTIKKKLFTIGGILEPIENFSSFYNANLDIYLPYETAIQKLTKYPPHLMHGILVRARSQEKIPGIERAIKRMLRNKHQLETNDPDDFTIWNQNGMAGAAESSSQTFNLFLLIVASLSLLVGGIGIMNIMLVSVTERTAEIGIRMTLGATPFLIAIQFLIESILLCLFGGILGIICGITAPHFVAKYTGWLVLISPESLIYALLITSIIGILFGLYPAIRASQKDIISSLHER